MVGGKLVYKAAVFHKHKEPFAIETIEAPEVKGEQVLIKTAGCGLCHTDLHIWLGEIPGLPEKVPAVLGHEPSGYVAAKGNSVPDHIKVGMKVLIQGAYYSEDDIYTLKGHNVLATKPCPSWTGAYGIYGGAYSEYFVVPSYRYLVNVEGLDDLAAASQLTDAGLTPYRAVKRGLNMVREFAEPEDFAVVVAVGGLGSYAPQYLNILAPYLNVIAVDIKDEALELASKVAKIHATVNPKKEDAIKKIREIVGSKKIPLILDFVGLENNIPTYLPLLAPGGTYVLVGLGALKASFPTQDLTLKEWNIIGSYWGSVADLREVAGLARRGAVRYRELVTKRWKLEEINEAFDTMHKGKYIGRMIIAFE
ncbi:MAG: zinc-binding dehydrogenase [Candidatus Methanomethylicaceae archaeon]|jgi:D-arabinose 1-dehydrogenase-like Zn-dependent alcohol dehydrogenase